MSLNVYQEISQSYLDTEVHKLKQIGVKEIPKFLKEICSELINDLEENFVSISDAIDLKGFRKRVSFIEQITDILSKVSSNNTSEWVLPLIKDCYRNLNLTPEDRQIIIVSSYNTMGFAVITDFTNILSQFSRHVKSRAFPKSDLFIIPLEIKFDISSMTLLGHEVGHVFINDNIEAVQKFIDDEFDKYIESKKAKVDIALLAEYLKISSQISKHIQECLCDDFGKLLFGAAFDFALLKLFCFSRIENQLSSKSHPPSKIRIEIARKDIQKTENISKDFDIALKNLCEYFLAIDGTAFTKSDEDNFCIEIASKIFQNSKLSNCRS